MNRLFCAITVLAVLVSACVPAANMAKSDLRRERNPQVSHASLETLVSGNNTFALDLYRSLRSNGGNLVISPYSVSTAFAMAYAGARGDTASQIASAFHFDLPEDQLHSAFNALDLALAEQTKVKLEEEDQDPPQLHVVNSLWAQEDFSFQSPFLDTLGSSYDTGIYLVDFADQPAAARQKINSLVRRETNDKIKDLIPQDALNEAPRLVLVNTIYFAADWQNFFDFAREARFQLLDGSQIDVPTMGLEQEYFPYAEGRNWLAVELPYAGETFAMLIIAPRSGEFDEFETNMGYQSVSAIISSLKMTGLDLYVPKFEFSNDFSLADQLKALGVSDALDAHADFSGMTGNRNLYLGDAFHKTYVAVDEEGTCAAAATEQRFIPINGILDVFIPVQIDRPFIFIIRDVKSGQFLFIGRVVNPAE